MSPTRIGLYGICMFLLSCNASVIDISHYFTLTNGRSCRETDIDAVYDIPHGRVWQVRCHNCTCVDGTKICTGPTCYIDYDPSLEHSCTQWSEDGCCCEHVGCVMGGERYSYGEWYPVPHNPCVSCLCDQGRGRRYRFSTDCVPEDIRLDESEIH